MNTVNFEQLMYLSFAVASISFTVAEMRLFAPLREWIQQRNPHLGELFLCSYCLGHWVAFGLVAIFQPRLFWFWWPLDYFLTALVIAWLAAFQTAFLSWLMEKADK